MSFDYNSFINQVWFLKRDIVSDGYDEALEIIKNIHHDLEIFKCPSGEKVWSWIIPDKWSVKKAYIKSHGKTLLDLSDHPLHVMSYSIPVSGKVKHEELMKHVHTSEKQPDAIPFEFSYYKKQWGFCLQYNRLQEFNSEEYEVLIDSVFEKGELKVGCIYIPGKTKKEIVLLSHLCHPCMVDDDLTGVAVTLALAKRLKSQENNYSYRILLVPETIGTIAYLSRNENLIENMKFGVFCEMLGNANPLSLQHSKQGNSLIDKSAKLALKESDLKFREGDFKEVVQNDERIINGPGVNIPTISLSRANFFLRNEWAYPEYHTSNDTPEIISEERLRQAEEVLWNTIRATDEAYIPRGKVKGPIFLSRYNLWVDWRIDPVLNSKMDDVFHYFHKSEKTNIEIATELELNLTSLNNWLNEFEKNGLILKDREF